MRAAAMLLVILMAGCATGQTAPTEVKVPVYMPCPTTVPDRPAFPADGLTEKDDIWQIGTALWADRRAREAYELMVVTRLTGCVTSPATP